MSQAETGDRTCQFNLQLAEAMIRRWGKQLDCFGNVSLLLITACSGTSHAHALGTPWLSRVGSCSWALLRHEFSQSKLLLHSFSEKKSLRSKITSVTSFTQCIALPFLSKPTPFRYLLRSWHFKHCCFLRDSYWHQNCLTPLLPRRLMGQNTVSAGLWIIPEMGKRSTGQKPWSRLGGQMKPHED